MAYDIGPKIGIDGESEFRKSIQNINANIKTLGSEMKVVTESFADNADGMDALAAKTAVLERTYEQQEKHLKEVRDMLERTKDKYGENATETLKWQRVVNESAAALKKTENELKDTRQAMDKLENSTDDAEDALKDLGDAAEKSGKGLSTMKVAAGNLIAQGVGKIADVVADVAGEIYNLDEATEEYRAAQGKLQTAFEAAGYSVDTASGAYTELYKILGDTDTATEAAQLMAKLSQSEEDFAEWTQIAAGVAGTFGDALPVEGLIEAANETAKTGKVTGSLADALNWAAISEDEFNKALEAAGSESERNKLIMETLSGAYDKASEAFYKNNEELIRSRENQAKLDEITGELGETVSDVKNAFLEEFGPAIADIGGEIADFIEGIDAEELAGKFDWAFETVKNIWDGAEPYFDSTMDIVTGLLGAAAEVAAGDWEGAWEDVKTAWGGAGKFFSQVVNDIAGSGLFKSLDAAGLFDYQIVAGELVKVRSGAEMQEIANAQAKEAERESMADAARAIREAANALNQQQQTTIVVDGKTLGSLTQSTQQNALASAGYMPLLFGK